MGIIILFILTNNKHLDAINHLIIRNSYFILFIRQLKLLGYNNVHVLDHFLWE